jgi:phosphatidate cytidylyltransferase
MLRQRVLTAIVLLAVLGATVSVQTPWPFMIFLGVACGCAAWEWSRLTRPHANTFAVTLGLVLFLLSLFQTQQWLSSATHDGILLNVICLLSALVWVCVIVPTVLRGESHAPARHFGWTLFAPVTLFATWMALASLFLQRGAAYVLTLLILIWIADIAAYFAGRAFGRNKLAPNISPGKTREGAAAGIAGVVIWIVVSAHWPDTFGGVLVSRWTLPGAILCAVFLACLSIIGDLFESLLKRRAGVKDSSSLLPGHGGVYDRIDAVVAVVPVAYLLSESLTW